MTDLLSMMQKSLEQLNLQPLLVPGRVVIVTVGTQLMRAWALDRRHLLEGWVSNFSASSSGINADGIRCEDEDDAGSELHSDECDGLSRLQPRAAFTCMREVLLQERELGFAKCPS